METYASLTVLSDVRIFTIPHLADVLDHVGRDVANAKELDRPGRRLGKDPERHHWS